VSKFPQDGSTFVVEAIDRTAYRWARYKPDGARPMGKPGRWQKQVVNGDWHRWENCEEPVGELSPSAEDGPISRAFKQAGGMSEIKQTPTPSSKTGGLEDEIARVVQSVNEWDDRTSPDDYPEHLLITSDELADILRNFATSIATINPEKF
jgi:hypothetical protein